jgi:transposase
MDRHQTDATQQAARRSAEMTVACSMDRTVFNKIKQCRRVAIRYDKLAANYLAFVKLASIRI